MNCVIPRAVEGLSVNVSLPLDSKRRRYGFETGKSRSAKNDSAKER